MKQASLPLGGLDRFRNDRAGFSLVEILTVLAIMSILSGLTLIAVNSSEAAKLTSAGNTISDVVTSARQNSIAQDAFTAIVVKTAPGGAYSSYCLLQLKYNPDGSYGQWTAISPWRSLPRGIFFYDDPSVTDNFLNTSDSVPVPMPTSFPYQGQPMNLTSGAAFHVYQPDGSLISNQEVRLRIIEGVSDPVSGTVKAKQPTGTGKPADRYDVMILRDTGLVNIERS